MTERTKTQTGGRARDVARKRRRAWTLRTFLLGIGLAGCATEREHQWVNDTPAAPPGQAAQTNVDPPVPMAGAVSLGPAPAQLVDAKDARSVDPEVKRTTSVEPSIKLLDLPPVVPPPAADYPIDLSTALRLAEVENPNIAIVRERVYEALAVLQGAYALMLPSFNAGVDYHGHTGNLQRSAGLILNESLQSLYVGGGDIAMIAGTVGVPAVSIYSPLTDAIYAPLAASQRVDQARLSAAGTTNQILLDVASLHFDLMFAEQSLYRRRETEAEGNELYRMTKAYADANQGRPADMNRAATELAILHREVQNAEGAVAVASARLAERLHLDPAVRIHPLEPEIQPIPLINLLTPTEELVRAALQRRPEVGATAAGIGAAEADLRREQMRPLLPTLFLGFSGGAFGGGSNLVPPLLGNFGGRTDFDVGAYWTLENFGLGNLAKIRNMQATVGEAVASQSAVVAQVRSEVAAAQSMARAQQQRIEITRNQLKRAREGFREELIRIQNTLSRSVEAVTALELLDHARQDYLFALTEYNRAQFQLWVALGSPPPLAPGAEAQPLPAAPIAFPPTPAPSPFRSYLNWDGRENPAQAADAERSSAAGARTAIPPK